METIFLTLWNRSLAALWLILAVAVLRLLLKRAPRAVVCLLWALVAVRLLCPLTLQSAASLLPKPNAATVQAQSAGVPLRSSGSEAVDAAFGTALTQAQAGMPGSLPLHTLALVWLAGLAAMLVYFAMSDLLLRRRVAAAVPLRDDLWQCETVSSPFVLGLLRPRVYLPFGIEGEALDCVAAHEHAHIARRDNWVKPLAFLLLAAYWFAPQVWLAYILLCRDIELACDERAVRDMDLAGRKAYSSALLACAAPRSAAVCPVAFGEKDVSARIKAVLNYKKPPFWLLAAALAACVVVAVCFLTEPKQTESAAASASPAQETAVPQTLEAAFSQAIVAGAADEAQPADYCAEAHKTLGTSGEGTDSVTIYAAVYCEEYGNRGGGAFTVLSGYCCPRALTFAVKDGAYTLTEDWWPQDGSLYEPSIREKFPAGLVDAAMNGTDSAASSALRAECQAKAKAYFESHDTASVS